MIGNSIGETSWQGAMHRGTISQLARRLHGPTPPTVLCGSARNLVSGPRARAYASRPVLTSRAPGRPGVTRITSWDSPNRGRLASRSRVVDPPGAGVGLGRRLPEVRSARRPALRVPQGLRRSRGPGAQDVSTGREAWARARGLETRLRADPHSTVGGSVRGVGAQAG
jgi:hypothetical protein